MYTEAPAWCPPRTVSPTTLRLRQFTWSFSPRSRFRRKTFVQTRPPDFPSGFCCPEQQPTPTRREDSHVDVSAVRERRSRMRRSKSSGCGSIRVFFFCRKSQREKQTQGVLGSEEGDLGIPEGNSDHVTEESSINMHGRRSPPPLGGRFLPDVPLALARTHLTRKNREATVNWRKTSVCVCWVRYARFKNDSRHLGVPALSCHCRKQVWI